MTASPLMFLDVDGILHGKMMKYGYERTAIILEKIPRELVHPALRPRKLGHGGQELPDWVARRRPVPTHVTFRTPVRTSTKLREDIAALGVDVHMLTTWLEHDSVDQFFGQTGGTPFAYSKLRFPGRPLDDELGAIPERWKVDEVIRVLDADPRPFIWVDDDEVPRWREEIEGRYPDVPKLLIAPIYDVGITPRHMDLMREFVGAHGPA